MLASAGGLARLQLVDAAVEVSEQLNRSHGFTDLQHKALVAQPGGPGSVFIATSALSDSPTRFLPETCSVYLRVGSHSGHGFR